MLSVTATALCQLQGAPVTTLPDELISRVIKTNTYLMALDQSRGSLFVSVWVLQCFDMQ